MGIALAQQGNLPEAIACDRKAVELEPKGALRYSNLGGHLQQQGKFDEAIACFRKAMQLDPNSEQARVNLVATLNQQGKFDEGLAVCREVVKRNPKSAVALNSLAWALATCADRTLRNPTEAVMHAEKAVELAPQDGNNWNTLGVAQYRAGDWIAATKSLQKSMQLRKNGGDAFDWFFLAMAHWRLDHEDEALQWYSKAVSAMETNQTKDELLLRFRREAEELMEPPAIAPDP